MRHNEETKSIINVLWGILGGDAARASLDGSPRLLWELNGVWSENADAHVTSKEKCFSGRKTIIHKSRNLFTFSRKKQPLWPERSESGDSGVRWDLESSLQSDSLLVNFILCCTKNSMPCKQTTYPKDILRIWFEQNLHSLNLFCCGQWHPSYTELC